MSRSVVIHTPEGVELEFRLAGLGSRFMAVLMDMIIQMLATLVLMLVLGLSLFQFSQLQGLQWWGIAIFILVFFAIFDGYFIVFEALWNGQTPGKRMVGLRVMRDGGYPLDFRGAVIRNMMRLVDALPGGYAVGMLFILIDRHNRRLGDIAAGTLVVREREESAGVPNVTDSWQSAGQLSLTPPDGDVVLPVEVLNGEHFDLAETFLRRRVQLDPRLRVQMGEQIAAQLRTAMGVARESLPWGAERLLEEVVRARARRAGL